MKRTHTIAALAVATGLAACEGGFGVAGGDTEVLLSQDGSAPVASALASELLANSALGNVSLSSVEQIEVTLTGVDALPQGEADVEEGAWISLTLTETAVIDLLDLPGEEDGGIQIARGDLPAGTYGNLRLFVEGASITFNTGVEVGPQSFDAGVEYDLFIPSADQTGVKVPDATFTVSEGDGETVVVVFDADTSVQNVTAAGASGTIIMNPVLRAGAANTDE